MQIISDSDICFKDAVELAGLIRNREVSATEVMTAFLSQIERVNPKVNAICTLVGEEAALRAAKEADERLARGQTPGPLHGLPHAVKDLVPTAGIRTTFGSRIYKDFVPDTDGLIVERLKAAGAIIIGKTNVPEFGAGSHTFNEVFGATLNPYDITKTLVVEAAAARQWRWPAAWFRLLTAATLEARSGIPPATVTSSDFGQRPAVFPSIHQLLARARFQ